MKSFFNQYPKVFFTLVLFYLIEEIIFYNFYYTVALGYSDEFGLDSFTDNYSYAFSIENFFFASSILTLCGGLLFDRIQNVKKVFQWAVSFIFLGSVLILIKSQIALILSVLFVLTGSALFGIGVIIHIAVLFPYADDMKDNAFMIWLLMAGVAMFIAGLFVNFQYESMAGGLISVGLSLLLLILVSQNKLIGYEISDSDEESDNEPVNLFPLFFCTGLFILLDFYITFMPSLNQVSQYYIGFGSAAGYSVALMSIVFWITVVWYLISKAKSYPRQLQKIILGTAFLVGVGILEFITQNGDSVEFDLLTDNMMMYVPTLVIYPCLYSILTHNNFDKNAGLWLGLMIGVPQILTDFIENQVFADNIMPVGIVILVLFPATLIWMRENKDFLYQKLNLEESNQELEEDETSEDPYDHLIP